MAFRLFHQPLWFHATECCGASLCRFKSVPTWLGDCADRVAHARDASLQPEYSCCYQVRYRCLVVNPPGKFQFSHLGEIVKMLCQELGIYTCIYTYIYMKLFIIDVDFFYQFNLGWLHHFSQFLFMKSLKNKCFFKFSKVGRFVIGWRSG